MNTPAPLRHHALALIALSGALAGAALASLATAFFLFALFDAVLPTRSEPLLLGMLGTLVIVLVGQAGLRWVAGAIGERIAGSLGEAEAQGDTPRPAALAFFRGKGPLLLADLLAVPLVLGMIGVLSRELGALAILTLVAMIVLRRGLRSDPGPSREALRRRRQLLEGREANAETGLSPAALARRIAALRLAEDAAGADGRIAERRFQLASGLLRDLSHAAMLALGAFLVIEGRLSIGGMVAVGLMTMRLVSPVRTWLLAPAPLRQIALELRAAGGSRVTEPPSAIGDFEIEGMAEATLRLPAGSLLLVTGPSGSGKSHWLRAMAGLRPDARMRLGGRAPATLPVAAIGWSAPDARLIPGTVSEAIANGEASLGREATRRAAERAGLLPAIERLEAGFDTMLSGRGAPLPYRALRRLSLARAIARAPALLVLDDPLVGLGAEDEHRLVRLVAEERRRGAIVVVALPHPLAGLEPTRHVELGLVEARIAAARTPRRAGGRR